MSTCEDCGDAQATARVQRRLGDVAVGRPLCLCESCANALAGVGA